VGINNFVTQRAWLTDAQLLKTCKGMGKGTHAHRRTGIWKEPMGNYPAHKLVVESLAGAPILGNTLTIDPGHWDEPSQMRGAKSCSASVVSGAGRLKGAVRTTHTLGLPYGATGLLLWVTTKRSLHLDSRNG